MKKIFIFAMMCLFAVCFCSCDSDNVDESTLSIDNIDFSYFKDKKFKLTNETGSVFNDAIFDFSVNDNFIWQDYCWEKWHCGGYRVYNINDDKLKEEGRLIGYKRELTEMHITLARITRDAYRTYLELKLDLYPYTDKIDADPDHWYFWARTYNQYLFEIIDVNYNEVTMKPYIQFSSIQEHPDWVVGMFEDNAILKLTRIY